MVVYCCLHLCFALLFHFISASSLLHYPFSPSLQPLHKLSPACTLSVCSKSILPAISPIYVCISVTCYYSPLCFTFNISLGKKLIISCGYIFFASLSISLTSLPKQTVSFPSYSPPSSAKHSCSHT